MKIVTFLFGDTRGPTNKKNTFIITISNLHKTQDKDIGIAADKALDS